jgi:septal ring factor EnvC (AmiA/AmiB activator)
VHKEIQDQKKSTQELEHQIGQLYGDTKTLERKNKELQDQTGHFTLDIKALEDKKRMMDVELMQQKQQMKDRVDKEHQSVIKDSEERIQEAQLEMSKRLQILEREMLEEIMGRKENLVRDIIIVIETRIAKVLEPAKWDQVSSTIFEGISETI